MNSRKWPLDCFWLKTVFNELSSDWTVIISECQSFVIRGLHWPNVIFRCKHKSLKLLNCWKFIKIANVILSENTIFQKNQLTFYIALDKFCANFDKSATRFRLAKLFPIIIRDIIWVLFTHFTYNFLRLEETWIFIFPDISSLSYCKLLEQLFGFVWS